MHFEIESAGINELMEIRVMGFPIVWCIVLENEFMPTHQGMCNEAAFTH